MQLERAIRYACDGRALLFVGAGFSSKAFNLDDKEFPVASKLAKTLCEDMGIANNSNLSLVSDMYIDSPKYGIPRIIDHLNRAYRFKSWGTARETYLTVLNLPWRRIYTTNYDNLCETALTELGKVVTPTTLSDSVGDYSCVQTVVHLNGYIDRLNATTLQKEFKLSSTSYLAEDFCKSDWLTLFKAELNTAQTLIFIGVSFDYDIDLQRIISNSSAYKDKIVFIDRELEPDEDSVTRNYYKEKFGTVYNIGVDALAQTIKEVQGKYVPFSQNIVYSSFEKVESEKSTFRDIMSVDTHKLFQFGYIDRNIVPYNMDNNRYLIPRTAEHTLIKYLEETSDCDCVVLTSDLANGKSCLITRAAYNLQNKGSVYFFRCYDIANTLEELKEIVSLPGAKYIFIENYNFQYETLKLFKYINLRSNNVKLILTARSVIYENTSYKISDYTGIDNANIFELNIDLLSSDDITHLISELDWCGIWDEFRNMPAQRKVKLIRNKYNCHFNELLLDLIKSHRVSEEITKLYQEISKDSLSTTLLIGICISNLIGLDLSLSDLLDILEIKISQAVRQNTYLLQFVDFSGDCFSARSSILSQHLLRQPLLTSKVMDILVKLNLNADRCSRTERVNAIRIALISFSNINLIFPSQTVTSRVSLMEYYNSIKDLSVYRNNQFFWLQFAIASMDAKEYSRAEKQLEIAYKIVQEKNKTRPFDPYQIDTQKARHLLEAAIYTSDSEHAFPAFEEAHKLLVGVIRRRRGQEHLVFKQVAIYYDFYIYFRKSFSGAQQMRILSACREFLEFCESFLLKGVNGGNQQRITTETDSSLKKLQQELMQDIPKSVVNS